MDYKEFLKEIRRRIQEKVDGEVRAETIKKNNSVNMDGLLIQEKGQNISPVIYLNPYYRSYLDGRDMERIADDIYRCYLKNKPADDFDISCFTDFEQVKSRIVYRLVNYEKNKPLLKEVPYRKYLDLAPHVLHQERPGQELEVAGRGVLRLWRSGLLRHRQHRPVQ